MTLQDFVHFSSATEPIHIVAEQGVRGRGGGLQMGSNASFGRHQSLLTMEALGRSIYLSIRRSICLSICISFSPSACLSVFIIYFICPDVPPSLSHSLTLIPSPSPSNTPLNITLVFAVTLSHLQTPPDAAPFSFREVRGGVTQVRRVMFRRTGGTIGQVNTLGHRP